jgi:hypothetical protein
MEYYSAIKRNKVLLETNLENIMLSGKKSHIVGFDLHEISRMDRVKGNGAETRIRKYGVI